MMQPSLTSLVIFAKLVGAATLSLPQSEDPCVCLTWKEAYQNKVRCGSGSEFYFMTGDSAPSASLVTQSRAKSSPFTREFSGKNRGQMFCTEFFETLDFNTCLNVNIGKDEGTWCYVDPECENLNNGAKLHSNISWKKCSSLSDRNFREFTPEALFNFSKQNDLPFSILDKYAYTGHGGVEDKDVFVHTYDFEGGTVPRQVGTFINSSTPLIFDTHTDGHVPHVIVHNGKAYRVDYDEPQDNKHHPGNWAKLRCILGC